MSKIKFGVLRETKTPPDRRVALAPMQALEFQKKFPFVELFVQPSDLRAYTNEEFLALGIQMKEDLSDCDILIGVKEVAIDTLIPEKKYMFFSHTAKKQPANRELLQAILEKNIELIDYEYLTDIHNIRLVAFGRWAGMVGAYNAMIAWGKKNGTYNLKRAHECHDMAEFIGELKKVKLPPMKILITGGGRVAHGAMETLAHVNIEQVTPQQFLSKKFDKPVFCQIDPWHYNKRKDGDPFDLKHFFKHPYEYMSTFVPYTKAADMLIACHYWDPRAPRFLTIDDYKAPDFSLKVIADVSCDIGGPLPSTLRTSSIEEPFYGLDRINFCETSAFEKDSITVMAVDNLPGEAPRNASIDFSKDLIDKVFPSLFEEDTEDIIKKATITKDGKLTALFSYLQNYVDGKE